jgi:hypothetical protein
MKILALLLAATVVALTAIGCGSADVDVGCRGHCELCGDGPPCCDDGCTISLDGSARCIDFPGEICP